MTGIRNDNDILEQGDNDDFTDNRNQGEINEENDDGQNDSIERIAIQRDNETNDDDEIADESEEPDTDISLSNVEKSRVTIAGHDLFILDFYKQGIKVAPVNPLDVEKIQAVFVEPNEYQEGLNKLLSQRLLVIQGQPHIGKFTFALGMGL